METKEEVTTMEDQNDPKISVANGDSASFCIH